VAGSVIVTAVGRRLFRIKLNHPWCGKTVYNRVLTRKGRVFKDVFKQITIIGTGD
jgi:hypothetical protein